MIILRICLWCLAAIFGIALLYVLLLAVSSLFVNTNKIYKKHSRYYRCLLNGFTALAAWFLRIKIHTEGLEKIPEGTRFLLVQNHRSKFDPILTWLVLKKYDVAFISKEANMHIPIFGRIIRKCCFMAIDREDPGKALGTVKNAAQLIRDNQVSIGIYPEGTRNRGEGLLPFHNAVFKIAQLGKVPIVVTAMKGADNVAKNFPRHHTDVYLTITGVLNYEDIAKAKTSAIGEEVERQIKEAYAKN